MCFFIPPIPIPHFLSVIAPLKRFKSCTYPGFRRWRRRPAPQTGNRDFRARRGSGRGGASECLKHLHHLRRRVDIAFVLQSKKRNSSASASSSLSSTTSKKSRKSKVRVFYFFSRERKTVWILFSIFSRQVNDARRPREKYHKRGSSWNWTRSLRGMRSEAATAASVVKTTLVLLLLTGSNSSSRGIAGLQRTVFHLLT